jgi:hypothetical protein
MELAESGQLRRCVVRRKHWNADVVKVLFRSTGHSSVVHLVVSDKRSTFQVLDLKTLNSETPDHYLTLSIYDGLEFR